MRRGSCFVCSIRLGEDIVQMKFKDKLKQLSGEEIDRIVEMAWEDRTPFEAIETQFGLVESEVIKLMRREMKLSSWKMWRARVQGRSTKHAMLRGFAAGRHKCSRQRRISNNKISKR